MILTKVQNAQEMGKYKPTQIDQAKKDVDFRLMQVSPYYIKWSNGRGEIVSLRKLRMLQEKYSWIVDF